MARESHFAAIFGTYGALGSARLLWELLLTKVTFPRARLLRRPLYIRGRSRVSIGRGFTSGPGLRIDALGPDARIQIGDDVEVNNNVHIGAIDSVVIGDRVLIAGGVFIADHNHGIYSGNGIHSSPYSPPGERVLAGQAIRIENDVWLGEHVCVLPGVEIGRGSVIGAGSVVTKSLPPLVLAVGAPARVIKRYDESSKKWLPAP